MPHITLATTPQGLILQVVIGMSSPRINALQVEGKPIPEAIPIIALIDTGADSTVIDKSIMARLGIPAIGTTAVHTPSTGAQPIDCLIFDVCLGIPSHQPGSFITIFDTLSVIESDFAGQGGIYNALIGRDVLARGLLFYNGTQSAYTLSF